MCGAVHRREFGDSAAFHELLQHPSYSQQQKQSEGTSICWTAGCVRNLDDVAQHHFQGQKSNPETQTNETYECGRVIWDINIGKRRR